jgi:hypothetical protein
MLDGGAPFRRDKHGAVYDKRNERIELMGASSDVLTELATDPKWSDTEVVRRSARTSSRRGWGLGGIGCGGRGQRPERQRTWVWKAGRNWVLQSRQTAP